MYSCLHTLSQCCTAILTGGGRGCGDILTAMAAVSQQEVQFNAAQGPKGFVKGSSSL